MLPRDFTTAQGSAPLKRLLQEGVAAGVFPGAVLLVARQGRIVCLESVGHRAYGTATGRVRPKTIFDLASLTKPLAISLAFMKLVGDGLLDLDEPLFEALDEDVPKDKHGVTVRRLLSHSAGLADWHPFFREGFQGDASRRKRAVREWILRQPLSYPPGIRAVYSDLGFMLLEGVVEKVTGGGLAGYVKRHFFDPLGLERTFLDTGGGLARYGPEAFAPTEVCPWRRQVVLGAVHDENAFALGGHSGHAGLFGTALEVHTLLAFLRDHYLQRRKDILAGGVVGRFWQRQATPPGSTWALGWDTPSHQESSTGRYFSVHSVGHLGFTGTSAWMDLEKDVEVVLLTNRIHPRRENSRIRAFRPRLHDAVMVHLGLASA